MLYQQEQRQCSGTKQEDTYGLDFKMTLSKKVVEAIKETTNGVKYGKT